MKASGWFFILSRSLVSSGSSFVQFLLGNVSSWRTFDFESCLWSQLCLDLRPLVLDLDLVFPILVLMNLTSFSDITLKTLPHPKAQHWTKHQFHVNNTGSVSLICPCRHAYCGNKRFSTMRSNIIPTASRRWRYISISLSK